jgi:hypothetical protein
MGLGPGPYVALELTELVLGSLRAAVLGGARHVSNQVLEARHAGNGGHHVSMGLASVDATSPAPDARPLGQRAGDDLIRSVSNCR